MNGPRQCLVTQFSATSCLPAGYARHAIASNRTHSDLVKFAIHDIEYDKVLHILTRLQQNMSESNDIVEEGDQNSQWAMISSNEGPANPSVNQFIEDNQHKRPAEKVYLSSKRLRVSSSPTEGLSAQACNPLVNALPSQKEMSDLKKFLIDQLYFKQIDERLTHLTPAQGTTCRWFLTKPEYLKWQTFSQRSDHGGFLWIKGNPGTGKSTLMKFLFETAKLDAKGDSSQMMLSFFFLARGAIEEKTTTGLYRSLLHQTFEKARDLRDSLDWMTIDGARTIQRHGWQDQVLQQTLMHAVRKLGQRSMTIFVDALDECNQSQAESMISFFEELCHCATEERVGLKICFSSRYYPTMIIQKGIEVNLEDTIGHADDIRQFIKSRLRLRKSKHVESLRSEILQKSSGIFLWVVLVLDILNSDKSMPMRKAREHLKCIPPGLNDLFTMILGCDQDKPDDLQLSLQWILFAARPMRVQEFYFAVQFGRDKQCSGYWDQDDVTFDNMETFVRNSTKGLAETVRTEASKVQFIHESVRDYLLGRYQSQWYGPSGDFLAFSHQILKASCLAQVLAPVSKSIEIPDFLPRNDALPQLRDAIELKFPFLQYAVHNLFHHANAAQLHGIDQRSFLADFPLKVWTNLRNALMEDGIDRYTKAVTLLYVLAEYDAADLIGIHSQRSACFELENEHFLAPAVAAVASGSWRAVQAFSKAHAEYQPPSSLIHRLCAHIGQNPRFIKRFSPGSIATYLYEEGNESIVFAFLLWCGGSEVNRADEFQRTPLYWAAKRGHEAVVNLLLERGADVNVMDDLEDTPIWLAAKNGHEGVMEMLLEKEADINLQDWRGQTPLWHSIRRKDERSLQLLLKYGANVESRDVSNRTPLWYASIWGGDCFVKLLLDHGANIDSQDSNGWTPLWCAVDDGNRAAVEILVKNGANLEAKDSSGRTPLSWATKFGSEMIVRLLLKEGAIVDSRALEDFPPLSLAVETKRPTVVKVLVDRMISRHASLALEKETEAIVGILFEKLATLYPVNEQEKLPLGWWAVDEGNLIIAKLLPELSDQPGPSFMLSEARHSWDGIISSLLSYDTVGKQLQGNWTRLLWVALFGTDDYLDLVPEMPARFRPIPCTPIADKATMIRFLIGRGADIYVRDTTGRTILSRAVSIADSTAVIELLLEEGAVLESKVARGRVPLSWAVRLYDNVAVVDLLLKRGANVETKDDAGWTPLRAAQESYRNNFNAVLELLLEHGAVM